LGRSQLAGNHAAHLRGIGFLILGIDAGVAQFRVSEGDQLTDVAGIGDHLLIAGHAGVEHHFADGGSNRPEGKAAQQGAIRQHQQRLTRGRGRGGSQRH